MRPNCHFDVANTIKSALTMREIAVFYGFSINKGGYICCPFHTEKTASCRLYEHSFYCFGCGKGGDVIKFVQEYFGLTFAQAIVKIGIDFGLNVPSSLPREQLHHNAIAKQERQSKKIKLQKQKQAVWEELNKLMELHRQYWFDTKEFKPKNMEDIPDGRFIAAISNIEYVRYRIEVMEAVWSKLKT